MELFKAKLGSPVTQLAANITNTQTTISLVNAGVLPDAPNIATIGTGVNAETIRYSGKSLNTLTGVTRGFTGTAKAWTSGQPIARIFTQYDHDSLVDEVTTHKAENESDGVHGLGYECLRINATSAQSIPNNEDTVLTFSEIQTNTSSLLSYNAQNPSRITVNFTGKIRIYAQCPWAADNNGVRLLEIKKNGQALTRPDARQGIMPYTDPALSGLSAMLRVFVTDVNCVSGDYFECIVKQTSGGSLSTSSANRALTFGIEVIKT